MTDDEGSGLGWMLTFILGLLLLTAVVIIVMLCVLESTQ
jgi:hypothetical protein